MNDDFKSQLTALALDELPADERAAVAAALAEAPEAQAYADETRAFCGLLTHSLAAPAATALTDEQRSSLVRRLAEAPAELKVVSPGRARGLFFAWTTGLGAAAAAVVLANHLMWKNEADSVAVLGSLKTGQAPAAGRETPAGVVAEGWSDLAAAAGEAPALLAAALPAPIPPPSANQPLAPGEEAARGVSLAGSVAASGARPLDPNSPGKPVAADALAAADSLPPARAEGPVAAAPFGFEDSVADGFQRGAGAAGSEPAPAGAIAAAAAPEPADAGLASSDFRRRGGASAAGPVERFGEARELSETIRLDTLADATDAATPGENELGGIRLEKSNVPFSLAQTEASLGEYSLRLSKEQQVGYSRERQAETKLESRLPSLRYHRPSMTVETAEDYAEVPENPFLAVAAAPLSTFSIDVDTAGYANVRRFLNLGQRPPKAAVRLEELVNYFRYDYPPPDADKPFSVTVDLAGCPWQPQHRLARIGLQGRKVAREQRPSANLVFLVDVSGSMDEPNKLPLVQQSLHLLTSQLKGGDHVAIVTYAGSSGVALPSTSLEQKEAVGRAIDALAAGGSTNGASGIQLAYQQARQHFKKDGVNRVLLATDGDFNVGLTTRDELQKLITDEAKSGVFLSVLGYGMDNLKDATMEMLADMGNGNYAYIDSLGEARKALAEQLEGTLMTIAKDVKIQVEFNPAHVRHYRLLGYENRMLAKEDFNDDTKDAGEIGAGHSVTALYEIVPVSAPPIQPPVDPLKYQPAPATAVAAADPAASSEAMTVKLRSKTPDGATSQLLEVPVADRDTAFSEAPADFKFAASVAMTGLLLKDSGHKGAATWDMVRELARAGKGPDAEGYRGEFLQLVEKAAGVAP
jgi:secreted protein with Ig-like and vWFA domain